MGTSASSNPLHDVAAGSRISRGPSSVLALLVAVTVGVGMRWSGGADRQPADDRGAGVPIGTIVAFGGPATAVPETQGWILCDGREMTIESRRELFAAIGTAWGGNPTGRTFRLPDLRGRFVRGVNYGAAGEWRDPEAAQRSSIASGGNAGDEVGSAQYESVGPHNHSLSGVADAAGPGFGAEWLRFHATKIPDESAPVVQNGAAISAGGAAETRPHNAYVNWIIRVR